MSSPYLHRAGASSLPNDYAIVSHFSAPNPDSEDNLLGRSDDEEDPLLNDLSDSSVSGSPKRYLGIPIRGRPSFSHYGSTRASHPIIYESYSTQPQRDRTASFASLSHLDAPSRRVSQEQDALLADISRIEEPVEQTQTLTEAQVWKQEAKIIWRYTLPVFG